MPKHKHSGKEEREEKHSHCWTSAGMAIIGLNHNCATCCFCGLFKNHPEHSLEKEEQHEHLWNRDGSCRGCGMVFGEHISLPPQESWLNEFKKEFEKHKFGCTLTKCEKSCDWERLESFIESLLLETRKQEREELVKKIEGMKREISEPTEEDGVYRGLQVMKNNINNSYNKALQDIINLVSK